MKQIDQTEQQIEKITKLTSSLKEELLEVWEAAVRSSHHFLTEADIDFFRPRIRDMYFPAVDLYVIRNKRDKGIAAFMGLSDDMVEMLFVSPAEKGKGFGTVLLHYALQEKHIHKVDVNEDNEEAYRFYLRRGYRVIGRDETDADGKPFPIIHLEKMKKIIIVCDSYKGCLTSKDVNEAMALGVKDSASLGADASEIITLEMSDGGEGMLDAFLSAMGGERVMLHAHDALMRWIDAAYGIVKIKSNDAVAGFKKDDDVAIIEIAQAAGLALIEPEQRNPMKATSWGVGEMIMNAYRRGIRRFIVGLGGSATSDCGIGMLKAMGDDWKKIRENCEFVLASDVTNPLCGQQGAAHVFAPQKGADETTVEMLDKRAEKFAEVSARHFGCDKSNTPGAGAAGGLGYAFLQYFDAEFQPGAELLLQVVGFDSLLKDADLVITGEGHSDKQTLMGKLPQRILQHGLEQGKKVWLVSGGVSDEQAMLDAGFDRVIAVTPKNMPLSEAMKPEVARENIAKALR